MIIHPVEYNGIIQSSAEIAHSKQSEDAKALLQQSALQSIANETANEQIHEVKGDINTDKETFDPNRDGDGSGYQKQKDKEEKNRKKKQKVVGKVVDKNSHTHFDMSV